MWYQRAAKAYGVQQTRNVSTITSVCFRIRVLWSRGFLILDLHPLPAAPAAPAVATLDETSRPGDACTFREVISVEVSRPSAVVKRGRDEREDGCT